VKWLKHSIENESDLIEELVSIWGGDGYYGYWMTVEVMGRHFDIHKPGENEFLWQVFKKKLTLSDKKLKEILHYCSKHYEKNEGRSGILFKMEGQRVHLKCNKLQDSADDYTRKCMDKLQTNSRQTSENVPLEVEAEENKKRKEDTTTKGNEKNGIFFKGDYFVVTNEDKKIYCNTYNLSTVLFLDELKKMTAWLYSNPANKKKNHKRFINNWLKGEKKDGRSRKNARTGESKYPVDIQ